MAFTSEENIIALSGFEQRCYIIVSRLIFVIIQKNPSDNNHGSLKVHLKFIELIRKSIF